MNKLYYIPVALVFMVFGYYLPEVPSVLQMVKSFETVDLDKNGGQEEYEIAVIYIGCSSCPASNAEGLPDAVLSIKEKIRNEASSQGLPVKYIGISKDLSFEKEIHHLSKSGSYDEIIIGNQWSNMGILKYSFEDFHGPLSIPQIIVTKRKFRTIENVGKKSFRGLESESLILRKIGYKEIQNLAHVERILND